MTKMIYKSVHYIVYRIILKYQKDDTKNIIYDVVSDVQNVLEYFNDHENGEDVCGYVHDIVETSDEYNAYVCVVCVRLNPTAVGSAAKHAHAAANKALGWYSCVATTAVVETGSIEDILNDENWK